MTKIERHINSIEFCFSDKYQTLLRVTLPIKRGKEGVSTWYKAMKDSISEAYNIQRHQIKGKHRIIESKVFDRILLEFPGGTSLDMPDDVVPYDIQIILHYLEGVRMSLQDPRSEREMPNKQK